MKVLEVKSSAPAQPEYASELPGGTFLRGRQYKHVYVVTADGDVVKLSNGVITNERMKTSEYEVFNSDTKITFEV